MRCAGSLPWTSGSRRPPRSAGGSRCSAAAAAAAAASESRACQGGAPGRALPEALTPVGAPRWALNERPTAAAATAAATVALAEAVAVVVVVAVAVAVAVVGPAPTVSPATAPATAPATVDRARPTSSTRPPSPWAPSRARPNSSTRPPAPSPSPRGRRRGRPKSSTRPPSPLPSPPPPSARHSPQRHRALATTRAGASIQCACRDCSCIRTRRSGGSMSHQMRRAFRRARRPRRITRATPE